MLERAALCIEPTAQLFARRIDPPVRSVRTLGQSFWQNGGNDLHIPPWWPLYLKSVRQTPSSPRSVPPECGAPQLAKTSQAHLPASSKPPQDRKAQPRSVAAVCSGRRRYSQSSLRRQLPQAVSDDIEDHPPSPPPQVLPAKRKEQKDDGKKHVDSGLQHLTLRSAAQHQQPIDRHETNAPQHMAVEMKEQEIGQLSSLATRRRPDYDGIWRLFIASSDQHGIASAVLAHLAKSSERRDHDRALQVISIMEVDNRSKTDYDVAVRSAVQMRRYSVAFRICQEAANKGIDETCRQILLDGCLSQGLWKTAARVWTSFFEPSLAAGRDSVSNWNIIEAQRNLPTFLSHLCTQLQQDDPGLQAEHTTLLALVASLSLHLFRSHDIMAFILPRGLFQLLWQFQQLSILEETHYKTALKTLISSEMPRRRTDLAVTIYRNFRFIYPDGYISSGWLVSLIRLCDKDGYPLDIFRFWLQERKSSSNAKPRRKIYRHLMWAVGRQGDVDSVEELFRESIELLGSPTEIKDVNPRLYAHAVTGDADAVQKLLQEAKNLYGLSGDIVSWNILLFACSRSKEPRRIFAAFDAMDKRSIHPDAVTFETLIGVCSRIGDAPAASSLVEVAKDYNVPITDDMLAMIVHARCLNDESEQAEKLAQRAQSMGIITPIRTWNTLLRHYAFQADFRAIRRIRALMSGTGVEPDDMSHAAILTSLVRVGKTEDALKLLRTLHFDRTITATSFHYSIILHGFAMEKNRNMVEVIYREMEERFPQLSPSAQLAKLHTQLQRVWVRLLEKTELATQGGQMPFELRFKLDIEQAISFVDNIMSQQSTDRIVSDPQPGFQRRPAHEAVPSVFPETLAGIMALNRQPIQAQSLLDHYDSSRRLDNQSGPEDSKSNIQNLTSRLLVASRLAHWTDADKLWCKILLLGVQSGLPGSSVLSVAPSELQMTSPRGMMEHVLSTLQGHGLKVLPAMKFRLSMSLSFYMQALAHQKRQSELTTLVADFQRLGFALSSKNWNSYIQVLCRSADRLHQLLAYHTFDKVMLANTPPLKVISRSKWVPRQTRGRPTRSPVSRQLLEDVCPGQNMPTYFTMVYMASVLSRFHRQAARGDPINLQHLWTRFAQIVRIVERIPQHRDRVRRLILAGRNAHREPAKQPRYHRVLRAGVAGSKSLLDYAPAEQTLEIASTAGGEYTTSGEEGLRIKGDLQVASMLEGETFRGRLWKQKRSELETEVDREARTLKRTSKLLERVEQLRREATNQPLVVHELTGDPRHITRPKHLFPSRDKSDPGSEPKRGFVVDRYALKSAKSELRERRKVRVRIPLSSMQLGQRLVPPKSRRQEQKNSFSINKSRRRSDINHRVEATRLREQTLAQLRNPEIQTARLDHTETEHQYALVDSMAATDSEASGPPGKPFVPRGRTWAGDMPGSKLIDKLLPKRSILPYDRDQLRAVRRAARDKKRQDALEAALASPYQETPQNHHQVLLTSRTYEIREDENGSGPDDQNMHRRAEKTKTHELWQWDQGDLGWKSF